MLLFIMQYYYFIITVDHVKVKLKFEHGLKICKGDPQNSEELFIALYVQGMFYMNLFHCGLY